MRPLRPRGLAAGLPALLAASALAIPLLAAAWPAPTRVQGPFRVEQPPVVNCVSPEQRAAVDAALRAFAHPARVAVPEQTALYPKYLWPLDKDLGNGLLLANYVDDDSTAAFHDYMNGPQTYDTHAGTDLTFYNFRLSDRGEPIRAATDGTVTYMSNTSTSDRNCGYAPDGGNWVWLANGDGTFTSYYHLRANSMTVQLGDFVPAGTVLGLVGSSGYSTQPHLHFEAGDYLSGPYRPRDPWHGTRNTLPSLWKLQEDYVGFSHMWVADMGIFNETVGNGDQYYSGYCAFINRLQEPVVFGVSEPTLYVWFQYQAQVGDAYTMEIRKPDNSVYWSVPDTVRQRDTWDWLYYIFPFQVYVPPADSGMWTARVLVGNAVAKQTQFRVGATTVFGPRFYPIAGKSFVMSGSAQKDTLRVSKLGGPVTYSLANAPGFVSLHDSVVTVAATSTQATRSIYFQAVATDGTGRRDTMWYNVVDFSKPQNAPAGVEGTRPPLALQLAATRPNPFHGSTQIHFALPQAGRTRLEIVDAAGRRVARLVDGMLSAGDHDASWDGRGAGGRGAAAGVYFCRLTADGGSVTRKLVRF